MTGNITQLTLDVTKLLHTKNYEAVSVQNINKQLGIVAFFCKQSREGLLVGVLQNFPKSGCLKVCNRYLAKLFVNTTTICSAEKSRKRNISVAPG